MELVPWKPFGDLSSYRKEIDRFFTGFLREIPFQERFAEHWLPPIEISETQDKVIVKAELLVWRQRMLP